MVCQAASQTRFRALKYENGIAGSATIVVRVIACFQPLQDCQVSDEQQLYVDLFFQQNQKELDGLCLIYSLFHYLIYSFCFFL